MGLLTLVTHYLRALFADSSILVLVFASCSAVFLLAILVNVLQQLLITNPNEPPVVFHWIPFIGSTITYGIDPFKFFFRAKEKVTLTSAVSKPGCSN